MVWKLCLLLFASALADVDMVATPFGGLPRRSDCVFELDSVSDSASEFAIPPECNTDGYVDEVNAMRMERQSFTTSPDNSFANSFLEAKQLPIAHKWLDNAGSFPLGNGPTADIGHFEGTYIVPSPPPNPNPGTILFYFIGLENNNSQVGGPLQILQPVLTYGWGPGGQNIWQFFSWDCCPSNVTVHSKPITVQPGDTIQTSIDRTDSSTWTITGTDMTTGQSSTLTSHLGDFKFDYADVTMEVYQLTACNQFSPLIMQFLNLNMTDSTKTTILNPTWSLSGPTVCGGQITQTGSNMFNIIHNPSAPSFRSIRKSHRSSSHIVHPQTTASFRRARKSQLILTP